MAVRQWRNKAATYIWIFNVGRGLCIFVRLGAGFGILYDLGKRDDFSPTQFVRDELLDLLQPYVRPAQEASGLVEGAADTTRRSWKIAQVILSHPHADHISEIEAVADDQAPLYPHLLTCPNDKKPEDPERDERIDFSRVNNPDSSLELINAYRRAYEGRELPLQTLRPTGTSIPNLHYGLYYVRPPVVDEMFPEDDQKYTNGTSLAMWLRHQRHTLLLPGDLPPEVTERICADGCGVEKRYTIFSRREMERRQQWTHQTADQPGLREVLARHGLTILVAPHHGLKSSFPTAVYDSLGDRKPSLVIISERSKRESDVPGEVDPRYQSEEGASGLDVDVEGERQERRSLSTRNDGHILIIFDSTAKPKVYARKNAEDLLDLAVESAE